MEKKISRSSKGARPLVEVIKAKGANPIEDSGGVPAHHAIIDGDHPQLDELPPEEVADIQNGRFEIQAVEVRDPQQEIDRLNFMSE